jgi:hypothetical protein
MARSLTILVALAVGLTATTALAGSVTLPDIGGGTLTFDEKQFVTDTGTSTGTIAEEWKVVGSDLSRFARVGGVNFGKEDSSLELLFGGEIRDGAGTDIWIWEIGLVDDVTVTIGNVTKTYAATDTGADAPSNGFDVWLVEVDINDFVGGTGGDTGISSIVIETALRDEADWADPDEPEWHTPDLGAVAAYQTFDNTNRYAVVPLPSSALMGLGLLGVALAGRALRRRRRR